jgi:hypothetical protein
MIIRCAVCRADPAGRWKQPPALLYRDPRQDTPPPPGVRDEYRARWRPKFFCREHVSSKRKGEIERMEEARGWADDDCAPWVRMDLHAPKTYEKERQRARETVAMVRWEEANKPDAGE